MCPDDGIVVETRRARNETENLGGVVNSIVGGKICRLGG